MADRPLDAGTRPYPWPYDGGRDPGRLALVVAGAQDWWMSRTWQPLVALEAMERAAKVVRDAGGAIVVLRHEGRGGLVTEPVATDAVVECAGMSGFAGGPLDLRLRALGVDRLAVGGLGLESAVYSTVGAANDRGYECLTLVDASAAHDPAVAERAVSSITMSGGIFGAVGTTSDLTEHLEERA